MGSVPVEKEIIMFKVQKFKKTVTPSGGGVLFNTSNLYGDLVAIRVKPTTSSTKWHLKITDPDGFITWESGTLVTGQHNDIGISAILGMVSGVHTCEITNATVDEPFTIRLDVRQYAIQH